MLGDVAEDLGAPREFPLAKVRQAAAGQQLATITVANGKVVLPTPTTFPADNLYQTDWVFRELQEAIAENRRQEEMANP